MNKWRNVNISGGNTVHLCVIIPIYDESKRIISTVQNIEMNTTVDKIVLVATSREKEAYEKHTKGMLKKLYEKTNTEEILSYLRIEGFDEASFLDIADFKQLFEKGKNLILKRKSTIDIANELKERYSNVIVYHYFGTGYMSAQVNFGIKNYYKDYGNKEENLLFALYNADSKIDQKAINWVRRVKSENLDTHVIFQQYGNYTQNMGKIINNSGISKYILESAGLWQTRWSIGYEMANALQQFPDNEPFSKQFKIKNKKLLKFTYCIGHGLYFDYDTYQTFNGFTEVTPNEDMMFGLQACYYEIPVVPVPYLEYSDSPMLVKSLFIQKTTWYYGPIYAFTYKRIIESTLHSTNKYKKFHLLFYTFALFENSVRWIIAPTLVFIMLIFSLCLPPASLINLVFIYIYQPVLNKYCYHLTSTNKSSFVSKQPLAVFSVITFFLHGLSGIRALFQVIGRRLFHIQFQKMKTPLE